MLSRPSLTALLLASSLTAAACSDDTPATGGAGEGGGAAAGGSAAGGGGAGGESVGTGGGAVGGSAEGGSGTGGAGGAAPVDVDTLDSNRNRLLETYVDYLQSHGGEVQSNGLSGDNVDGTCDLWTALDPSSKATFLTITLRLQGSKLGADASSMLWHVQKLYRITGGEGATASDPGSCGGGEFNRLMMSMAPELHAALLAANEHQGEAQGGVFDIADAPPQGTFWRDSHDAGGAHSPFDASDETDEGAPRGQTQFFQDPASTLAQSPLGRLDLEALVDPYALEMDQDYDCIHDSNPLCTYTTYGPLCFPEQTREGVDIFALKYGAVDLDWSPEGCP